MDILQNLPVEIADTILEKLSTNDLQSCMCVSKCWRRLTNKRRVWKPHCLSIGISQEILDVPDNENMEEMAMCNSAEAWAVRSKNILSWRQRKFTRHNWPILDDPKAYTIHGNRMVIRTEQMIHVYLIKGDGIVKHDNINVPWKSYFEFRLMEMNENYIIVGFNNVILVYELHDTYVLKMGFTFNKDATMSNRCIWDFIDTGRNTFFVNILKIIKLSEDSLWVKVKCMYFHATYFHINLNSGKATNVFPNRNVKYLFGGESILMFREEENEVLLYSTKGGNFLKRMILDPFFSLVSNDKVLAVTTGGNTISTFEVSSGKKITNLSLPKFPKFTAVNPISDSLYCIYEDNTSNKDVLSSFSMRDGQELWSKPLNVKSSDFFCINADNLTVLYGAFVVIKIGNEHSYLDEEDLKKEYFVFDAKCGELLYRKSYENFLLFTELYLCDQKFIRSVA